MAAKNQRLKLEEEDHSTSSPTAEQSKTKIHYDSSDLHSIDDIMSQEIEPNSPAGSEHHQEVKVEETSEFMMLFNTDSMNISSKKGNT